MNPNYEKDPRAMAKTITVEVEIAQGIDGTISGRFVVPFVGKGLTRDLGFGWSKSSKAFALICGSKQIQGTFDKLLGNFTDWIPEEKKA